MLASRVSTWPRDSFLPQHDRSALIETHNVERVLADIDANHRDRSIEFLRHGVLLALVAPMPALLAGGAGARPDHSITGLRGTSWIGACLLIRSPRRHAWRQILADLREELTRAKGLAEVSIATRGTSLVLIPAQGIGRDDDDGDGTERGIRLDPAGS